MGVFSKFTNGLAKSRDKFKASMYDLIGRGPDLSEEFWEDLEETLVLSDMGGQAAMDIVDNLRMEAKKRDLPDSYAVLDLLGEQIEGAFAEGAAEVFGDGPQVVLFVGINGTGKTTTVGKIAKEATDSGRKVILGSADTFRAAAIEQLQVWADRAGVEMVTRERGSDPASVCFETVERAESEGDDLVLIDTAGRLHTSDDLMRELVKVVNVTRKRAQQPVYTVLVIDATTGQNGMQQAREFDKALDLDALVVTKLDGTAKGGIALAISHELGLPIAKIGVGEGIDDLRDFDAHDFARALIGDFEEEDLMDDEELAEASSAPTSTSDVSNEEEAMLDVTEPQEDVQVDVAEHFTRSDSGDDVSAAGSNVSGEAPSSDETDAPKKMSWAEFVEADDARKAAEPQKKHFWEKW